MRWLLQILIKMKLKIPWSCRIMLRCQRGVGWRRYFIVEGQTNFTKCNRNGKCSDYPNPDHKYLLDFDLFSVVISIQSFSQFYIDSIVAERLNPQRVPLWLIILPLVCYYYIYSMLSRLCILLLKLISYNRILPLVCWCSAIARLLI